MRRRASSVVLTFGWLRQYTQVATFNPTTVEASTPLLHEVRSQMSGDDGNLTPTPSAVAGLTSFFASSGGNGDPIVTAGGSVASAVPSVPKPMIGGLSQPNHNGIRTPWCGGKPNISWSASANALPTPKTPMCNRYQSGKDKTYGFEKATQCAWPKKFKKGDSITEYARRVNSHLEKHGLDTVMYVPEMEHDPAQDMVNVVTSFDRVTVEHVRAKSQALRAIKYDDYDHENNSAAKLFLLDTLDPSLEDRLHLRLAHDGSDTAATVFMLIMKLVQDESIERHNRIREQLKALSPSNEVGQNVSLYCDKARKLCSQLWDARQFEWILVLYMVKALLTVSVDAFKALFYPL